MLSPGGSAASASGGTTTPSQLRSAVAGLWSTVLAGSSGSSLPNHGIPVPSTYDKLLEKHHTSLLQMKLSDPDLQETIARGFKRFQTRMRESQAQTNASLQNIGIPYIISELHDDIRYENAQAKVIRKQQDKTMVSPNERKFRIAQELAEARIKAQQALQLTGSNHPAVTYDDDEVSLSSSSTSSSSSSSGASDVDATATATGKEMGADSPQSPKATSHNNSQSPTSVVLLDMKDGLHSSSFVRLTPQQKHALTNVVEDEEDEDIQEVVVG